MGVVSSEQLAAKLGVVLTLLCPTESSAKTASRSPTGTESKWSLHSRGSRPQQVSPDGESPAISTCGGVDFDRAKKWLVVLWTRDWTNWSAQTRRTSSCRSTGSWSTIEVGLVMSTLIVGHEQGEPKPPPVPDPPWPPQISAIPISHSAHTTLTLTLLNPPQRNSLHHPACHPHHPYPPLLPPPRPIPPALRLPNSPQ